MKKKHLFMTLLMPLLFCSLASCGNAKSSSEAKVFVNNVETKPLTKLPESSETEPIFTVDGVKLNANDALTFKYKGNDVTSKTSLVDTENNNLTKDFKVIETASSASITFSVHSNDTYTVFVSGKDPVPPAEGYAALVGDKVASFKLVSSNVYAARVDLKKGEEVSIYKDSVILNNVKARDLENNNIQPTQDNKFLAHNDYILPTAEDYSIILDVRDNECIIFGFGFKASEYSFTLNDNKFLYDLESGSYRFKDKNCKGYGASVVLKANDILTLYKSGSVFSNFFMIVEGSNVVFVQEFDPNKQLKVLNDHDPKGAPNIVFYQDKSDSGWYIFVGEAKKI